MHAGRSAQLHRVTPSLSPSSVRVCSHSFPQNSPLEVDDEGFVIRADSTQNDILLLLLHSGPGKTIKEYFCFEPVIKNNRGSRCVANKEDATEKPQCSRNCFEMSWKRGGDSSVTRDLTGSRWHQLRVTFNNLCPKESSVIFFRHLSAVSRPLRGFYFVFGLFRSFCSNLFSLEHQCFWFNVPVSAHEHSQPKRLSASYSRSIVFFMSALFQFHARI